MKEKLSLALGFILLILLGYGGYELIIWLVSALKTIDPTFGASLVTAIATIVPSVYIASYNYRKARERIAFEANREKKAEIYNEFMKIFVDMMKKSKAGKKNQEALPDNIEDFFYNFTSKIIVYGGPGVVKAYADWRAAASNKNPSDQLSLMDNLFREIRSDLGESNKNIEKQDLIRLFLKNDE